MALCTFRPFWPQVFFHHGNEGEEVVGGITCCCWTKAATFTHSKYSTLQRARIVSCFYSGFLASLRCERFLRFAPKPSRQYPLAAPLDKLIQHHAHIIHDEPANIESKKLGGVAGAEFEPHVCGRGMLESGIFNLTGDLICWHPSAPDIHL